MFTTLIYKETGEYCLIYGDELATCTIPKLMSEGVTKETLINYFKETHSSHLAKEIDEKCEIIKIKIEKYEQR